MSSNPHLATLDTLIAIGTTLAQDIQQARQSNEITPTEAAEAFERVARATRRTVLLAAHLAKPKPETTTQAATRTARRELIRTIEDAITREPRLDPPAKQALEAEFRERLDAPELAEDLAARPVADIIADIMRDLDLGRPPFTDGPNWRRRTPAAIRRLHARAAGTLDLADPEPDPNPDPAPDRPDPTTQPGLRQLHTQILQSATGSPGLKPRTPSAPPPPH